MAFQDTSNVSDVNEEQVLLPSERDTLDYLAEVTTAPPPLPPTQHVSSLDFERIINEYSIQAIREQWLQSERPKRHLLGYTGRTATRWILSALAGLLTGLASVLIVSITTRSVAWRSSQMQSFIQDPSKSDVYVLCIFTALNLVAALSSSWLCVAWAPQAAGSGIAQVKAYLNGIRGNFAHLRVRFFVKVVGTILSVSSCLAIGMEGPLIYIGALMGAGCTKVSTAISRQVKKCQYCKEGCTYSTRDATGRSAPSCTRRWLSWADNELSHFSTDAERRDFVSIGASCGFAASFGAPIGGLLFILDDVSCYFNRSLLLRMLVANAIGTFCLAFKRGDLSDYSVINLGDYVTRNDDVFFTRIAEVPFYLFMGVVGGILGGVFCASFMWLRRNITDRFPARGHGRGKFQLMEVALVSLLTSVLLFYLPSLEWACKDRAELDYTVNDFTTAEYHGEHIRFFCPAGQVNELGNILFGSRIDAIKRILTDPTDFKRETLLTVGVLFYFLMALTYGTTLPSGIFTPSVLIGASLGGVAGITFEEWFGSEIAPSTFALLGVAALLAGIQRSTVSLCVILVEGTGQIKVLMPSIIVVVVARYVASLIYKKGIFEAVLEWKQMPYLDKVDNKRWYDAIQVSEIMSDPPTVTVHPIERVEDLVDLLRNSIHNGFPVVDPKTNKFLGLVRRDQIAALLECGVVEKKVGNLGREQQPHRSTGIEQSPLMRQAYHINDDRYDYVLDATPVVQLHKVVDVPTDAAATSARLDTNDFVTLPTEFASIYKDERGFLVASCLDPAYRRYSVNLGAVMNRGTLCVRKCMLLAVVILCVVCPCNSISFLFSLSIIAEYTPVSKAYKLFTSMGLRYIVVTGGHSGGEVVGMLSRPNFLPEHIHNRTLGVGSFGLSRTSLFPAIGLCSSATLVDGAYD